LEENFKTNKISFSQISASNFIYKKRDEKRSYLGLSDILHEKKVLKSILKYSFFVNFPK
jgi:hypothetical protein